MLHATTGSSIPLKGMSTPSLRDTQLPRLLCVWPNARAGTLQRKGEEVSYKICPNQALLNGGSRVNYRMVAKCPFIS